MNEQIILTQDALTKVFELIKEEDNQDLKLRVFLQGGGCSGFQYGFIFDEIAAEDDFIFEKELNSNKISILVDPMSMQYLHGATVDYISNLQGEQFSIRNPNATTTCGCGSSFSA